MREETTGKLLAGTKIDAGEMGDNGTLARGPAAPTKPQLV